MTKREQEQKDIINSLTVRWGKAIRKIAQIREWFAVHDATPEIHNGSVLLFTEATNKAEDQSDKYPYLQELMLSADDVTPTWSFDEQQADPINRHWDWEKAKRELRQLLTEIPAPEPVTRRVEMPKEEGRRR